MLPRSILRNALALVLRSQMRMPTLSVSQTLDTKMKTTRTLLQSLTALAAIGAFSLAAANLSAQEAGHEGHDHAGHDHDRSFARR